MLAARFGLVELGHRLRVPGLLAEAAHHPHPAQRLLQVAGDRADPLPVSR